MTGFIRESRYDRERRQQEREHSLREFRQYVDNNNPPILSDLKMRIKPIVEWGYATLPDLLTIVNAKISPMKVVTKASDNGIVTGHYLDGLTMVDTRDTLTRNISSTQNFHGPVGTVGQNHGISVGEGPVVEGGSRHTSSLIQWLVAILGTVISGGLIYLLGWS